tara:strand:- start:316 stop:456 length:141 start_codon:yes stop_codon:yes gene_type:complete
MSNKKQVLINDLWKVLADNVYSLSEAQLRDLKYYVLEQSKEITRDR